MKRVLLLTLSVLIFFIFLTGCTDSQLENYSITEAPGVRITDQAMEAISHHAEEYNLSYIERSS